MNNEYLIFCKKMHQNHHSSSETFKRNKPKIHPFTRGTFSDSVIVKVQSVFMGIFIA